MLLISIFIILEDGFPIFFHQKRIGKDNLIFFIFKFRTMIVNTPNLATDKLNNPQKYYTNIGKILRKYSLDEIPQLFNILKNDMCFIGPRPALYNQEDLIYMRKKLGLDSLKPGITGWAQINGRDKISTAKKVKLDFYYLKNKSMLLDFKILFFTIFKVFKSEDIKI